MWEKEAAEFLAISHEFKLGLLPTESSHPQTRELGQLVHEDLPRALDILQNIDQSVLEKVLQQPKKLIQLREDIVQTLKNGGRIFLVGCGATGRLSLALETLWRQLIEIERLNVDKVLETSKDLENRVISFMAGGDVALISSVEKFEDFPQFGVRQMMELGFSENDLMIGSSEGGETPFVIGAVMHAAKISHRKPYFLYCNPDFILTQVATRSKEIIECTQVHKINLSVGPMALTGSTRMQATTILQSFLGLALLDLNFQQSSDVFLEKVEREWASLLHLFRQTDYKKLIPFIESEADIYRRDELILYETDAWTGLCVMTDTTERSPTFSLRPFENQNDSQEEKIPSLCHIMFPHTDCAEMAWQDLLKRPPRAFYWQEITERTRIERVYGHDFSHNLKKLRATYNHKNQHSFSIYFKNQQLCFSLRDENLSLAIPESLSIGSVQILLKVLLNTHSTLVMGKLNRYQSNLMTYVRASNNKLVDRAVRFCQILLQNNGVELDPHFYEKCVKLCFKYKDQIARDLPLVPYLMERYLIEKDQV